MWVIGYFLFLNCFFLCIMVFVGIIKDKLFGNVGVFEVVKGGFLFGFMWNMIV